MLYVSKFCSRLKKQRWPSIDFQIIFCWFQLVSSRWFLDYSVWDFSQIQFDRQRHPVAQLTIHSMYTHIHTQQRETQSRTNERNRHALKHTPTRRSRVLTGTGVGLKTSSSDKLGQQLPENQQLLAAVHSRRRSLATAKDRNRLFYRLLRRCCLP